LLTAASFQVCRKRAVGCAVTAAPARKSRTTVRASINGVIAIAERMLVLYQYRRNWYDALHTRHSTKRTYRSMRICTLDVWWHCRHQRTLSYPLSVI